MGAPLINDEFTEIQNVVAGILESYPNLKKETLVGLVTNNYRKYNSRLQVINKQSKIEKKKQ